MTISKKKISVNTVRVFCYLLFYCFFVFDCKNETHLKREKQIAHLIIYTLFNQPTSPFVCNPDAVSSPEGWSMARRWNEQTLSAIRVNVPKPTNHARNLFHVSAAMYDAWAAYDDKAKGWLFSNKYKTESTKIKSGREQAMSFAAYRILTHRYKTNPPTKNNPAADLIVSNMTNEFLSQCYNPSYYHIGDETPAAIGNTIANIYIQFGLSDGANEANGYADTTGYKSVNPPLYINQGWYAQFIQSTVNPFKNPNAWQEILFDDQITQNNISIGESTQAYISPNWDSVAPFALVRPAVGSLYIDPGTPIQIQFDQSGKEIDSPEYATQIAEVIRYSSKLDASLSSTIDISPASIGNSTLGKNDGKGRALNPFTNTAYNPQLVREGDFGRVIAEFWADGPRSETPPGHWYVISNSISDDIQLEKNFEGKTAITDRLEWDTKLFLALGGALHDAAVVAWGVKRKYTSVRPVTSIRRMGALGILPNTPGLIEKISSTSRGEGGVLQNAGFAFFHDGQQAIYAWPGQPSNPTTESSNVKWILADIWWPYQSKTFVTPAFPGFISGHSTFSRAAAEVLTLFTGSEFFPGGKYAVTRKAQESLHFEKGPSSDIALEWATYYDAADQAGLSRLWGGIHISTDDLEGRKAGSKIGISAFTRAKTLFSGN